MNSVELVKKTYKHQKFKKLMSAVMLVPTMTSPSILATGAFYAIPGAWSLLAVIPLAIVQIGVGLHLCDSMERIGRDTYGAFLRVMNRQHLRAIDARQKSIMQKLRQKTVDDDVMSEYLTSVIAKSFIQSWDHQDYLRREKFLFEQITDEVEQLVPREKLNVFLREKISQMPEVTLQLKKLDWDYTKRLLEVGYLLQDKDYQDVINVMYKPHHFEQLVNILERHPGSTDWSRLHALLVENYPEHDSQYNTFAQRLEKKLTDKPVQFFQKAAVVNMRNLSDLSQGLPEISKNYAYLSQHRPTGFTEFEHTYFETLKLIERTEQAMHMLDSEGQKKARELIADNMAALNESARELRDVAQGMVLKSLDLNRKVLRAQK